MNIEEKNHIEANKLIDKYYPYYYKKYPRNKFQVAKKYYNSFYKAAQMFSVREGYDAEKLIQSFMIDGFKFPQQLPNESVWKTFINYKAGLAEKKSKEVEITENIVNAALILKKVGTVQDWLDKRSNQLALQTNNVSFDLTLFSFSFSFEFYCLDNVINIDIKKLRSNILTIENTSIRIKLLKKIKEILGNDFINYSERNKTKIVF